LYKQFNERNIVLELRTFVLHIYVWVHISLHILTHKYGLANTQNSAITYGVDAEETYKYTKNLVSLIFVTGSLHLDILTWMIK